MPISEFKARCLQVLKEVRDDRVPMLVTLRGEPVAEVCPLHGGGEPKVRLGWLGSGAVIPDGIEKEAFGGDWEALT